MHADTIDHNDPRATAAAAVMLARELAPTIRDRLPSLLDPTSSGGLAIIADQMESDQLFGALVFRTLEDLLNQCGAAIQSGTTRRTEWVIARSIGGDDECEPIEIEDRTPAAEELGRITARIRDLLTLLARTDALLTAERIIAELR